MVEDGRAASRPAAQVATTSVGHASQPTGAPGCQARASKSGNGPDSSSRRRACTRGAGDGRAREPWRRCWTKQTGKDRSQPVGHAGVVHGRSPARDALATAGRPARDRSRSTCGTSGCRVGRGAAPGSRPGSSRSDNAPAGHAAAYLGGTPPIGHPHADSRAYSCPNDKKEGRDRFD